MDGGSDFEEEDISDEVEDEEMETKMDPLNSGINNAPPELEEVEKPRDEEQEKVQRSLQQELD